MLTKKEFKRLIAVAQRRRTALRDILQHEPHLLQAPLLGGKFTVLVHHSTAKPGWWQATFFDGAEPWGHTESKSWHELLETIHMDGVDWTAANLAPAKANRPRPGARRAARGATRR